MTRAHQAVPQNGADPDAAGIMDLITFRRLIRPHGRGSGKSTLFLQMDHYPDLPRVSVMEPSDSEDDSEDDLDTEDDLSGSVGGEATDFHEPTAVVADNVVGPSAAWAPAPPPELARRCKKWRTPNI